MRSIGIYVDKQIENDDVKNILDSIDIHNTDIVLFCDSPMLIQNLDYGFLPSFYMYFYPDPIVFITIETIKLFKDKLLSKNIFFYNTESKGYVNV